MFAWKKYKSTEEILLDIVLKKLDRIEQRVTAIIEADIARNEKPVSPAKAPKKRGRKPKYKTEKERKAAKKAYMKDWYEKNKSKVEDKSRKFHVGDKVQIVGKITASASQNQGHKGIITEVVPYNWNPKRDADIIRQNGGNYYLLVDETIDCWPNDLELIKRKKVTTKKK